MYLFLPFSEMEILWEAKSMLMHESQIEGGLSVPHVAGRLPENRRVSNASLGLVLFKLTL